MKQLLALALLATLCINTHSLFAQDAVTIAIFPFKNLGGEVKYDDLSWSFADSLQNYLNASELAGKSFNLVAMDDLRDQMLAQNIDVKSPSYEADVWEVAKALGATKIIWGTYFVKYDKANLEAKVVDGKTLMPDRQHFAENIRLPYGSALSSVTTVGDKILPAMK